LAASGGYFEEPLFQRWPFDAQIDQLIALGRDE
jgi:hypothetical protein